MFSNLTKLISFTTDCKLWAAFKTFVSCVCKIETTFFDVISYLTYILKSIRYMPIAQSIEECIDAYIAPSILATQGNPVNPQLES